MNQKIIKYLKKLLKHLQYYNKLAPFPVYDTDYVNDVKNRIMELENEKEITYDDEPVVACKYCKSLHIVTDEVDNDICMRCGSINELKSFENIHEYKEFLNGENT
jgi:DNA-directed RNA polymerase subunit RPC12/RpoP